MPKPCFFKTISSKQTKKIAGLLASVVMSRLSKIVPISSSILDKVGTSPSARNDKKRVIARRRSRRSNLKSALIFALTGDLGSGKTTFVQGFLRAAGIRKKITSPTFVLIKNYKLPRWQNHRGSSIKSGQTENYKRVYHIDCYRINPKELLDLGLKEILNNPENIILIEWPERIKKILPKDSIWIKFKYGEKINQRIITILSKRSSG